MTRPGWTPRAWTYLLDVNRFVLWYDLVHLGSDVWAADATVDVILNGADWRGMPA